MDYQIKDYNILVLTFEKKTQEYVSAKKGWDNVPADRKRQIEILRASIKQLDSLPKLQEAEKAKILMGFLLATIYEISGSYSWTKAENSDLYCALRDAIGLQKEHKFTSEQIISYFGLARKFISHELYVNGKSEEGLRLDHIFAHIEGWSLYSPEQKLLKNGTGQFLEFWDLLCSVIEKESKNIAKRSSDLLYTELAAKQPKVSGSWGLGAFFQIPSETANSDPAPAFSKPSETVNPNVNPAPAPQ